MQKLNQQLKKPFYHSISRSASDQNLYGIKKKKKRKFLTNDSIDKKLHYENALANIKKAENFAIRPNKREEYRRTYLGILEKFNNY